MLWRVLLGIVQVCGALAFIAGFLNNAPETRVPLQARIVYTVLHDSCNGCSFRASLRLLSERLQPARIIIARSVGAESKQQQQVAAKRNSEWQGVDGCFVATIASLLLLDKAKARIDSFALLPPHPSLQITELNEDEMGLAAAPVRLLQPASLHMVAADVLVSLVVIWSPLIT